jgi:hypothetical protein
VLLKQQIQFCKGSSLRFGHAEISVNDAEKADAGLKKKLARQP